MKFLSTLIAFILSFLGMDSMSSSHFDFLGSSTDNSISQPVTEQPATDAQMKEIRSHNYRNTKDATVTLQFVGPHTASQPVPVPGVSPQPEDLQTVAMDVGCNSYTGSIWFEGNVSHTGLFTGTMAVCSDAEQKQIDTLFSLLDGGTVIVSSDNTDTFTLRKGSQEMSFRKDV